MNSCLAQASGASDCESGWRRQFAHPSGMLGWVVGHLLAVKNRQRSEWVLSVLDVQPGDHVLEIGFGPGVDVRRVSEKVEHGFVAGLDSSREMFRQASRRNSIAIEAGLVELLCTSSQRIPYPANSFDKVFAINSLQFSLDIGRDLKEINRVLKPGGMVSVAVQPRSKGANERTVDQVASALGQHLQDAGFTALTSVRRLMKPVSCVCVQGAKAIDSGWVSDDFGEAAMEPRGFRPRSDR